MAAGESSRKGLDDANPNLTAGPEDVIHWRRNKSIEAPMPTMHQEKEKFLTDVLLHVTAGPEDGGMTRKSSYGSPRPTMHQEKEKFLTDLLLFCSTSDLTAEYPWRRTQSNPDPRPTMHQKKEKYSE